MEKPVSEVPGSFQGGSGLDKGRTVSKAEILQLSLLFAFLRSNRRLQSPELAKASSLPQGKSPHSNKQCGSRRAHRHRWVIYPPCVAQCPWGRAAVKPGAGGGMWCP